MGDGEISPIGPNRKSYLLEKNKPKRPQPTKITEQDPQYLMDKMKEKQPNFPRPVAKDTTEDKEHYYDPYKDKKFMPTLVSFTSFYNPCKD